MGALWQAGAKLCAVILLLGPVAFGFEGADSHARAHEVSACVDASELARSVVSISYYFDKPVRDAAGAEIFGERATAWFYTSPKLLVTAAHFASDLSDDTWQDAELWQESRDGEPGMTASVQLRVVSQRPAAGHASGPVPVSTVENDVAILELRDPFPNAQALDIQPEPPAVDENVLVLGYPRGRMQAARSTVRQMREPGRFDGLTLLEVQGDNRLLLSGGASGAPVLDCRNGRVVAVLNGLLTGPSLPFLQPSHSVVPTPWGSPTNTAVPAATLAAIGIPLP
jgi:hypothetical protein